MENINVSHVPVTSQLFLFLISQMIHGAGIFTYIETPEMTQFCRDSYTIYAMDHLGMAVVNGGMVIPILIPASTPQRSESQPLGVAQPLRHSRRPTLRKFLARPKLESWDETNINFKHMGFCMFLHENSCFRFLNIQKHQVKYSLSFTSRHLYDSIIHIIVPYSPGPS